MISQRFILSAGREGFEPSVEFYPDNRLAGGPNQPLWHLPNYQVVVRRRERDSNPRWSFRPTPVFKTGALNHSAIPPLFLDRRIDFNIFSFWPSHFLSCIKNCWTANANFPWMLCGIHDEWALQQSKDVPACVNPAEHVNILFTLREELNTQESQVIRLWFAFIFHPIPGSTGNWNHLSLPDLHSLGRYRQ